MSQLTRIDFKIAHAEKRQFRKAAKQDGETLSLWLRNLGRARLKELQSLDAAALGSRVSR